MASDTIYREVLRLKEGGKPVIVSMGNVAASGGYYISAPATKIVAQPSTVTGSIGVVSPSAVTPRPKLSFSSRTGHNRRQACLYSMYLLKFSASPLSV